MATQKKQLIRSSTPFEKVLEFDKEGMTLSWDTDDFGSLDSSQVRQLSKGNRDRYSVFEEMAREQASRDPEEESIATGFEVSGGTGSPSERLKVTSSRKDVVTRWERPDMVNVRKEQGWKVASKGHETLRGASSDGYHRIGSKGAEELILMEIPTAQWKKLKQARRNRRQRALQGATNQGKSEVRRLGSQPIDESSSGDFQPISREEGNDG